MTGLRSRDDPSAPRRRLRSGGAVLALAVLCLSSPSGAQNAAPLDLLPRSLREAAPASPGPADAGLAPIPATPLPPPDVQAPSDAQAPPETQVPEQAAPAAPPVQPADDTAPGGLPPDLWTRGDHGLLLQLIGRLPAPAASDLARSLGHRLLLAGIEAAPDDLFDAKVGRLYAGGDAAALAQIAEGLATPGTLSPEARDRLVAGLFATGDPARACPVAAAWAEFGGQTAQRGVALCRALSGDRAGAQLALDLAQDHGDGGLAPLVEALLGGQRPEGGSVDPADPAAVLAAARLQIPLPDGAFAPAGALTGPLLSKAAGSAEARAALAERMEDLGLLSTRDVAARYGDVNAGDGGGPVTGVRRRARLYRAVGEASGPATQAQAVLDFAAAAKEAGLLGGAARLVRSSVSSLAGGPLRPSVAAGLARVAAAAPDPATARRLAATAAADAAAAKGLWLFLVLLNGDEGGPLPPGADAYAATLGDGAARAGRLAMASQLLSGLGWGVPSVLVPGERAKASTALPASIEQRLDAAVSGGRTAEALLITLVMLGDKPLSAQDPTVVSAAVRTLARLKLDDDARQLALETALAWGL